jgi:phosphate:Na+ symporter
MGITIALAAKGLLTFETAAALVLGQNIGTTITAYLASLGTTTEAKRAAYAHIAFNILGAVWVIAIFRQYLWVTEYVLTGMGIEPNLMEMKDGVKTFPHIIAAIATFHTGFNIANIAIFLPFSRRMAAFLERIVPDKPFKEAPHLTRLDSHMLETPAIGMEQSRIEIVRMGEQVKAMMTKLRAILNDDPKSDDLVKKLFHREEVLDIMQKEVVVFLTDLLADASSHDIADEGRRQLRMADELESAGDYIAQILKLHLRLKGEGLAFPEEEKKSLVSLHDEICAYIEMVEQGFEERHPDIISKAHSRSEEITHHFREQRENHLNRCSETRMDSHITVCFTNSLNSYRRVKDHILNFAEAMAGEK